jgi:hypothetical protein
VLANAMLRDAGRLTVDYDVTTSGVRAQSGSHLPAGAMTALAAKFRTDPKDCLAHVRRNLHAIAGDTRLSPVERHERLERYLDAALSLSLTLDHIAFPPDPEGVVRSGVPTYVPDGLSDMGGESSLDDASRHRERIRVEKAAIFRQCRPVLLSILEKQSSKRDAVERIARFVFDRVRYNLDCPAMRANGASILLEDVIAAGEGVCRHQALVTQTLLQTLGITSRLMKCQFDSIGHACNLVRIDNDWYLLDVTNPNQNVDRSFASAYLEPIPERDVDLQTKRYIWHLPGRDARTGKVVPNCRVYVTRQDMFSRIVPPGRPPGKRVV